MIDLKNLQDASGLTDRDAAYVSELVDVLKANYPKHELRRRYYEDKVRVRSNGLKVPAEYMRNNYSTGWAAKAVNVLAERSILDGFLFAEGAPEGFEDAVRANDIKGLYSMAVPSMLIEGVGFWTVSKGETAEQQVVVNYHNAMTSAGIWDYRRKRLRACMVVADYARVGRKRHEVPSIVVLYTSEASVVIEREDGDKWNAVYYPHKMGVPMAVPMVYKKSDGKPFGKSRISPSVMGTVDKAMNELLNMDMQSDYFSIPMKYVLGASNEQYEAISASIHDAYKTEMLVMTTNDEGTTPTVGMLQAADMTPHIAVLDKLASMIASETCVPASMFGVQDKVYTSSDSLRAAVDSLVILCKDMNKANALALDNVARMMIAVLQDKPLAELDANAMSVSALFADPAMPSDAQNADAMVKIVSAVPEFAGTEVFWEKLGYPEEERKRIEASIKGNQAAMRIVDTLFGDTDEGTA